jgi:hypothetical protein
VIGICLGEWTTNEEVLWPSDIVAFLLVSEVSREGLDVFDLIARYMSTAFTMFSYDIYDDFMYDQNTEGYPRRRKYSINQVTKKAHRLGV